MVAVNPPVTVESLEAGIQKMKEFLSVSTYSGYRNTRWCLLMENAGEFIFHPRDGQPCYGEMRPYVSGEYRPSDLHWPFPDGTPVRIGVYWDWGKGHDRWLEKATNPERNPWRDVVKSAELIRATDGHITGVIIHDLNVNADTLVSFFLHVRNHYDRSVIEGLPFDTQEYMKYLQGRGSYTLFGVDPKRWFSATPDIIPENVFAQRGAYRRPVIEQVWYDAKQKGKKYLPNEEHKVLKPDALEAAVQSYIA